MAIKIAHPIAESHGAAWLRDLYARHAGELTRFLRSKYNLPPPDPEDVVQEAYAKLASMPERECASIQSPKAFLFRVSENIVISAKRRHVVARAHAQRIDLLEAARSDCTPERVLLAKDELELVARVLRAMPDKRRACFIMHRFDEMSYSDIARQSGMTLNGVKGHVERAMRDIARAMEAIERGQEDRT